MIVCADSTEGSHNGVFEFGAAILGDFGVGICTARHTAFDDSAAPVVEVYRVYRRVEVTAVVEVVAGTIAATHHFVALGYDSFVEVAAEPAVHVAVATVEFTFGGNRIVGEGRIFCVQVSVEVGAGGGGSEQS